MVSKKFSLCPLLFLGVQIFLRLRGFLQLLTAMTSSSHSEAAFQELRPSDAADESRFVD